jgi:signal transduction histidine kinase
MRLLLFELRPPQLDEGGLGAALRARLQAVEARAGLAIEVRLDDALCLPASVEQELYRIGVEALNNVLKHAQASRVAVTLAARGGRVRLEVRDDGAGFDPRKQNAAGGLGLAGMRERAARLGATLRVHSAPGAGTRVVVVARGGSEVPR